MRFPGSALLAGVLAALLLFTLPTAATRGYDSLREGAVITSRQAKRRAEEALGTAFFREGKNDSFPPAYTFYTENSMVELTKMDGRVLRFLWCRAVGEVRLSEESCRAYAVHHLERFGITDAHLHTAELVGGIYRCVFFAESSPAGRIALSVGADSGSLLSFDASHYYREKTA